MWRRRLSFSLLCCALVLTQGVVGQAVRDDDVPAGLNVADWSGILSAFEADVNDRRGLEHGYTVHGRPVLGDGPLTFVLAVRGGLTPQVLDDGRGVYFLGEGGGAVLNYTGLTVLDAAGNSLPARLELAPEGLLLSIDERCAVYPLTIDPLAQQAYLKASNTEAGDQFGASVALSGDTLLAGAQYEDSAAVGVDGDQSDNSAPDSGVAYIFDISDITPDPWTDQGSALAGILGDPLLVGNGTLAADSTSSVGLSNAAPSAISALFVALSGASVPFKGGTLKPFPFFDPLYLTTSAAGTINISFFMPVGIPGGTELWLQWAIQDGAAINGVALSNAIKGVTP